MTRSSPYPVVVALTGASGSAYAIRLLQVLLADGRDVELVSSDAARQVMLQETGAVLPDAASTESDWKTFLATVLTGEVCADWGCPELAEADLCGRLTVHSLKNYAAGIASGSFRTAGMVVCPCSGGTLGAIAGGLSNNLVHRCAEVHLKERRPLLLVTRETPLSLTAIRNMQLVTEAGAIIVPASPGLYHGPKRIGELVDFVVARICDLLHVDQTISHRWTGQ